MSVEDGSTARSSVSFKHLHEIERLPWSEMGHPNHPTSPFATLKIWRCSRSIDFSEDMWIS